MRRILALALVALFGSALVVGCAGPARSERVAATARPAQVDDTQANSDLAPAVNDFGFDLARKLVAEGDNTFISPLSVHACLSMTAMGAKGTTAEEMTRVLHLDGIAPAEQGWGYANLLDGLYEPQDATLEIANSVWAQEGAPFEQTFLDANAGYFGAEIRSVDFEAPGAAEAINDWVAENTHGKITSIMSEDARGVVMELVNAVYFQADWATPFDVESTQKKPFTLASGETVDADMMQATLEWEYGESDAMQVVRMPYVNADLAAYVLVPQGDETPESILETMDSTTWRALTRQLFPSVGSVAIPKLELEWGEETSLTGTLGELGMPSAFDPATADFSGMSAQLAAGNGLWISSVLHKTYLAVDETGTEAAAATGIGVAAGVVTEEGDLFELRADRPFIFAIADESSGALLFLGAIEDPTAQ